MAMILVEVGTSMLAAIMAVAAFRAAKAARSATQTARAAARRAESSIRESSSSEPERPCCRRFHGPAPNDLL
ncbi:MAG: hypothetical protein IRY99_27585 [Isosphaeraceae bacterium]|nr:hypothetical protein [Isosphaeraceae bacterium]